jgi:hypothetical protein
MTIRRPLVNNSGVIGELPIGDYINNAPVFRATASTAVTITTNTYIKLIYATVDFDTNSNYASSRFTPTVAGYYLISASSQLDNSPGLAVYFTSLWKNGSLSTISTYVGVLQSNASSYVQDLLYFNGSTDYVEIFGYAPSAGSGGTSSVTGYYHFSGSFVRST